MTATVSSAPFIWVSFGPGGTASQWYLPGEGGTGVDHRAANRVPVTVPSGYPVGTLLGIRRNSEGAVEFEWPPHLRDWRSLRTQLQQSPKFAAVMIAAESNPRLAMALQSFNSALSNLVNDGATEAEWRSLLFVWSRFKLALEAAESNAADNGKIPDGVANDIEAIATALNVDLNAPPPETPDSPPPPPSPQG